MYERTPGTIFAVLLLCAGTLGHTQSADPGPSLPPAPESALPATEGLNYLAGDAAMPPFSDSIIDDHSAFRRSLFRQGMALRVISQIQYTQNALDASVAADDQVYVGQRAFESAMIQPIFTADLRQLHLRQSQFYIGGVWNWVSWNPAGPKTLQLWDMYLYKAFGEKRVTVKAGYISNNMEFVGFFVGGSTATGAQGVYAILPYEVGMSYFPLTAPSVNVRVQGPKNTYFKTAAQRSLDTRGGPTEIARNHTGFRFLQNGDRLLSLNEGGFNRPAAPDAHEAWFRAGYMHNFTPYRDVVTGRSSSGNDCSYALMDGQLTQSNRDHPNQGLYLGASAETASDKLNAYARYFEARLYKEAPLRSRPNDVASLLASRTGYSKYFTENLQSQGSTVWRASTTLTGSYSARVTRGNYFGVGLSYIDGPAITPRVSNALNVVAVWTSFF